jgi:Cu(I)/Ag(I) efflux system membrane fusion protein
MSPVERASTLSLLAAVLLVAAAVVFAAIKEPPTNTPSIAEAAQMHAPAVDQAHASTPAQAMWTCPMHPEVMQDHPGRCPVCGVDLVQTAPPAQHSLLPGMEPAPVPAHLHVSATPTAHDHGTSTPAQAAWVCPMHPDVVQDHPGRCPICGMDLVQTQHQQHSDAGVQIDTATLQRMGVRTASVTERELARAVRAYGTVGVDEGRVLNVTAKSEGWVRRLYVSAVGQAVTPGMPLYELYSPELLARQREYIALSQRRDQIVATITDYKSQTSQVAASLARERLRAREKLIAADIDAETLRRIERENRAQETIIVRAEKAGFVTAINAREGSYVNPTSVLLTVADPRKLKIDVVLYPSQLAWVQAGDVVEVTTAAGERAYTGRLAAVSPVVDEASRTARAVIRLDNGDGRLLPGAYVDVTIATQSRTALALPRSALMWTGDGTVVMRALGDGRYAPAPVHTGIETDEWVEVTGGLAAGTHVAVNGQFLLDAAASLHAATQRLQGGH